MKTYQMFVEDYKSLNQRDQESRECFQDNLPDEKVLKNMSWNEMIRRLKLIYETEKREEIMKGLLSNPTHLDLIRNVPLKGPTPKPSSKKDTSSVRKTQTISKTEK
jgi:hypothetical protein